MNRSSAKHGTPTSTSKDRKEVIRLRRLIERYGKAKSHFDSPCPSCDNHVKGAHCRCAESHRALVVAERGLMREARAAV